LVLFFKWCYLQASLSVTEVSDSRLSSHLLYMTNVEVLTQRCQVRGRQSTTRDWNSNSLDHNNEKESLSITAKTKMTSGASAEATEAPNEEPSTTDKEEAKTEVKEVVDKSEESVKEVTEETLMGENNDEAPVKAKDEDEEPKKDDGSAKDHGEGDEDVTMTFPQRVSFCFELLSSLLIREG
jgi:hypothetical protein